MKTVKLISGGIDSYIMSQLYEGINLYIDFGQKYAHWETQALDRLGVEYDKVDLKSRFKENEIYIPDRNLLLATIANMVYEPDEILLAGLADDNCKDKTPEAFRAMSSILSDFSNKPVTVRSPFFDKSKGELIAAFSQKEKLRFTFSCYNPRKDGSPCGNCPACLRKAVALETNDVPCGYELSRDIIGQYLKKIHTYSPDRISRFFIWLKSRYKVYAVDLDGVLCTEGGVYKDRLPIWWAIEDVNKLDGIVVIYTARLEMDRPQTEEWLREHGVKYDALLTNKLPYDLIIDDRAENISKGW